MKETKIKPCPFCGGRGVAKRRAEESQQQFLADGWRMELQTVSVGCESCNIWFSLTWPSANVHADHGRVPVDENIEMRLDQNIEKWNSRKKDQIKKPSRSAAPAEADPA